MSWRMGASEHPCAISSWLEQQISPPPVPQCLALRTFEDEHVEVGTLGERGLWRRESIQPCLCDPTTPVLRLGEEDGGATHNCFRAVASPTSVFQSGKTEFWPPDNQGPCSHIVALLCQVLSCCTSFQGFPRKGSARGIHASNQLEPSGPCCHLRPGTEVSVFRRPALLRRRVGTYLILKQIESSRLCFACGMHYVSSRALSQGQM